MSPVQQPPAEPQVISHSHDRKRKLKRIVMNPPQSFLDAAALTNPITNNAATGPITVGQGGQAVLSDPGTDAGGTTAAGDQGQDPSDQATSPNTGDNEGEAGDSDQAVTGGPLLLAPGTASTVPETATEPATPPAEPTTSSSTPTIDSSSTPTIDTSQTTPTILTITTDGTSVLVISTTFTPSSSSATTVTMTPSSSAGSIVSSVSSSTSTLTSSISSSSVSASSSSSRPVPSSSASSKPDLVKAAPFIHSGIFVFLCILGSIVILSIIASALSWLFRRSFFSCCTVCQRRRRPSSVEGLSDVVASFHSATTSRNSSIMRRAFSRQSGEMTQVDAGLHRRATLLAREPEASPWLHSGDAEGFPTLHDIGNVRESQDLRGHPGNPGLGFVLFDKPTGGQSMADRERFHQESEGMDRRMNPSQAISVGKSVVPSLPAHLLGMTGPLEVKNACPGEMSRATSAVESILLPGVANTLGPRFLGVDGEGLRTPWAKQQLVDHGHTALSSWLGARDDVSMSGRGEPGSTPISRMSRSKSLSTTSRAGTWATTLRERLYAAIQVVKETVNNVNGSETDLEEDRYTPAVLPVHRRSGRKISASQLSAPEAGSIAQTFLTVSVSSDSDRPTQPSSAGQPKTRITGGGKLVGGRDVQGGHVVGESSTWDETSAEGWSDDTFGENRTGRT